MTNEEFQKLVLEQFSKLSNEIQAVKIEMATKSQQEENTELIQALIHRTDILDAKLDGLTVSTASKKALEQVEQKLDKILATQILQGESINILAMRQLNNEAEIEALKKAK